MVVYLKSGQKIEYILTDIRKLTFDIKNNVESDVVIPLIFKPNPFESITSIDIETIPKKEIEVRIYRLNGNIAYFQKIIPNSEVTTFNWDGLDLNNNKAEDGIYNVEVSSENKKLFAKIILMRK